MWTPLETDRRSDCSFCLSQLDDMLLLPTQRNICLCAYEGQISQDSTNRLSLMLSWATAQVWEPACRRGQRGPMGRLWDVTCEEWKHRVGREERSHVSPAPGNNSGPVSGRWPPLIFNCFFRPNSEGWAVGSFCLCTIITSVLHTSFLCTTSPAFVSEFNSSHPQ